MATKPATTPDEIEEQYAAAQAEANRLADRANAIREAGDATRQAVEINTLRDQYATLPKQAREARNAATEALEAVAAAPKLDLPALLAAFDKRQTLDYVCDAVATHTARLNLVDPMPDNPNGTQRQRPPQCQSRFAGAKFSDYLDALIARRANAACGTQANEFAIELEQTLDAAEQAARVQAAKLADGERLTVDSPELLRAKYQRAIAPITNEQVDELHANTGAGGLTALHSLQRDALAELLDAERNGHADDQDHTT